MVDLLHRRNDGSFVILHNGLPYHVVSGDPLYNATVAAYNADPNAVSPEPAPQPITPPPVKSVTRFQARMILRQMPNPQGGTMFDAAEAWVTAKGGEAKFAWDEATSFTRDGQLISEFAAEFGLTSEQLDAMFLAASQIEV
jgi:hypothetical protein